MPVLERAALEASPLADLHAIASELGLDGYRRLRKEALIDAITGASPAPEDPPVEDVEAEAEAEAPEPQDEPSRDEPAGAARRRRGRRGGRGRGPREEGEAEPARAEEPAAEPAGDGVVVEGVVELLPNGSGFLRTKPGEESDDDVYISASQVKRCELVNGDRVSGPRRTPRRSERFASLVRIDAVNGRPAAELADGARYDELPVAFPSIRFELGAGDPTLAAAAAVAPIGRGSRVTIVGGPRAGKSHLLNLLAGALAGVEGSQLFVALAGVRPEEITEWASRPTPPVAAVSFGASADAQDQAVELVVDQARRIGARGGHSIVLIDTLDGLHSHVARKLMAGARQIVDGGSVTIIATASQPLGGETTVIALDGAKTGAGAFPAVDVAASGTIRPELLIGEAAARAILKARAKATPR
jgi:transcription termination factor Rho